MLTIVHDKLNLKEFLSFTTSFIRDKYASEPKNIVSFFEIVLNGIIDKNNRDSAQIIDFQKICSSEIVSKRTKLLIKQIETGIYDEMLLNNFDSMLNGLQKNAADLDELFWELRNRIRKHFFNDQEYDELMINLDNHNYSLVLLALFKHGLTTLYNLPQSFAQRVYEEALTYDYDNPLRYTMFQLAADNGHKTAAHEYANAIAKEIPDLPLSREQISNALEYTLKAVPMPSALWNISYFLEKNDNNIYTPEQVRKIKTEVNIDQLLKTVDVPFKESNAVRCRVSDPDSIERRTLAYKICVYLAYTGFVKAFNSLGKYCDPIYGFLELTESGENDFGTLSNLSRYYYRKAIAGGNIIAMCNLGSSMLKQMRKKKAENCFDKSDPDVAFMLEIMQISAEANMYRSHANLGDYYREFESDIGRAKVEYAKSLDIKETSEVYMKLGAIAITDEDKIEYYNEALRLKNSDAAYYLAVLKIKEYKIKKKRSLLLEARMLIEHYSKSMSDKNQQLSNNLLNEIDEILAGTLLSQIE